MFSDDDPDKENQVPPDTEDVGSSSGGTVTGAGAVTVSVTRADTFPRAADLAAGDLGGSGRPSLPSSVSPVSQTRKNLMKYLGDEIQSSREISCEDGNIF